MGIYSDFIIPHAIALVMQNPAARLNREKIIPLAQGRVLEMGIGSGLNLPFYGVGVEQVLGVEPSAVLRAKAAKAAAELGRTLDFAGLDGADIELEDNTVDTVVATWVLCSIPEAAKALSEVRRVLKPGGRFLFIEHGLASKPAVAWWQNKMNRPWRFISGGCNMNRRPDKLIEAAGFSIEDLETGFDDGPKVLAFNYKGVARPR